MTRIFLTALLWLALGCAAASAQIIGGGGGGTVTIGTDSSTITPAVNGVTAAVNAAAITPPSSNTAIVSTAAEATHVLKASSGNLRSVYATNLTTTAGFLIVLNATTAPADGAVTPLDCVPLPAGGVASVIYGDWTPSVYSTGITAVVTSSATCFTKTTGVITAFIHGSVQ